MSVITDTFIGDEGVQALAKTLESNRTLTALTLESAYSDDLSVAVLVAMCSIPAREVVSEYQRVCSVCAGIGEIGDVGAQALAKALEANRTLTTLTLRSAYRTAVLVKFVLFEVRKWSCGER
jgi:hypothetical protein